MQEADAGTHRPESGGVPIRLDRTVAYAGRTVLSGAFAAGAHRPGSGGVSFGHPRPGAGHPGKGPPVVHRAQLPPRYWPRRRSCAECARGAAVNLTQVQLACSALKTVGSQMLRGKSIRAHCPSTAGRCGMAGGSHPWVAWDDEVIQWLAVQVPEHNSTESGDGCQQ